jgi:hypothetical protein
MGRLSEERTLGGSTAVNRPLRGIVIGMLMGLPATLAMAQAPATASAADPAVAREAFLAPLDSAPLDSVARTRAPWDSLAGSVGRMAGAEGPRTAALTAGINSVEDWSTASVSDTAVKRTKAVEYSEGYYKRLSVHRIASYAELPLFATEYILGQKLLNDERTSGTAPSGLRGAHSVVAGGLGVLFAVNTVTGVWNLLEARHDPNGRTRRTIHGLGMLLADAGFLWTASLAGNAKRSDAGANRHRNAAIASISVATASTLMMWLWKD